MSDLETESATAAATRLQYVWKSWNSISYWRRWPRLLLLSRRTLSSQFSFFLQQISYSFASVKYIFNASHRYNHRRSSCTGHHRARSVLQWSGNEHGMGAADQWRWYEYRVQRWGILLSECCMQYPLPWSSTVSTYCEWRQTWISSLELLFPENA